ncbi:hypothetical protein Chor_001992 [Crotalus horridus]
MFVQEEKIFAAKVLRLRICALDGAEWLEEVPEDTAIERLKERCLKHGIVHSAMAHLPVELLTGVVDYIAHHNESEGLTTASVVPSQHSLSPDLLALWRHRFHDCSASSFKTANLNAARDINSDIYLEWQALCLGSADNISCRLQKCLPGSLEDPKCVTHHKLIHAASEKVLSDTKTVSEENIQDRDVLVLVKKRAPPAPPKMADVSAEEKRKQEPKAPDKEAILKATTSLPSHSVDRSVAHHNMRDVNEDDRVDEIALRQLTEMGFPESRAIKALRLSHMSVTQAMEWLIEHADDPTADAPMPGHVPVESTAEEAGPALPPAVNGASSAAALEEPRDELTEIFKKIRRKREFRPDPRAVAALMEMGFDEKEVVDALRVNNNQQNAACEWLLGDRKPTPEDLDKGIDPASPLFQAILENPVVQLGLTNPKTLLAFEDMLENPLNSTQWMNDPETGPVMLQISRIFQTLNRT